MREITRISMSKNAKADIGSLAVNSVTKVSGPKYFFSGFYADGTCANLGAGTYTLLNTCSQSLETGGMFYVMSTAYTSTSGGMNLLNTQNYKDSSCSTLRYPSNSQHPNVTSPSTCISRSDFGYTIGGSTTLSATSSVITDLSYPTLNGVTIYTIYGTPACSASTTANAAIEVTYYMPAYCISYSGKSVFISTSGNTVTTYTNLVSSTCGTGTIQTYPANTCIPDALGTIGNYSSYTPSTIITTTKKCFAGSETVTMESGDVKSIADIIAGDRVLAADASGKTMFSPVVYVPYGPNQDTALFAHITTKNRDIKITMDHVLPAGTCGSSLPLVYASQVAVGNCIMTIAGQEKVSSVLSVKGNGLFTVITNEEYIVVNGIIASPFGANHMMANLYYNIHRFAFALSPLLLSSSFLRSVNEGLGVMIPFFTGSEFKNHL